MVNAALTFAMVLTAILLLLGDPAGAVEAASARPRPVAVVATARARVVRGARIEQVSGSDCQPERSDLGRQCTRRPAAGVRIDFL